MIFIILLVALASFTAGLYVALFMAIAANSKDVIECSADLTHAVYTAMGSGDLEYQVNKARGFLKADWYFSGFKNNKAECALEELRIAVCKAQRLLDAS